MKQQLQIWKEIAGRINKNNTIQYNTIQYSNTIQYNTIQYSLFNEGEKKNRGTVITSPQLVFTERVVPATQAFDWSLDNRC